MVTFCTEERFDAFLTEHPDAAWTTWNAPPGAAGWDAAPEDLRVDPWAFMMHAKGWTLVQHPGVVVGRHPWGYTRIRSRTRAALARVFVGEKP